jgi:thiamine pyrophosphate-dependent acetolactate synthase large subunit-like protein
MADDTVAQIIVNSLYNAGVRVVFGIPGAKVDAIFDCLLDHPEIRLIVCRHEQNAAMMAAAVGRITGVPGVCVATSGPGASNLATGLVTATTEGDPVVAIIGSVPRLMNTKRTHQSMKALDILGPTSKTAVGIDIEDQAAEIVLAAFRTASASPKGASVISIPSDIAKEKSKLLPFPTEAFTPPRYGPAP